MEVITAVDGLRARVALWRNAGETVALVPTMGNLHAGHLALIGHACQLADRCVVSIFVNPMQFGEGEDFGSYPRTFEADRQKLLEAGTDLLFAPSVEAIYPGGEQQQTRVEVPGLSDILCGASRPGHFVGVATVVCKLFNMVQPDLAVFGEKDYQQLLVIRRMVADLAMPLEIVGMPTVREPDGLARSSRNGYLTPSQRAQAPRLSRLLKDVAAAIRQGEGDYGVLAGRAAQRLRDAGFQPDYFSVRRAADLGPPQAGDRELVVLAAAYLGRTRLIDNLRVTRKTVD